MVNAFEQHGIAHLSHSHISSFVNDRGKWAMSYLLKKRTPPNLAMLQGTACEAGIEHGLKNWNESLNDCIEVATKRFQHDHGGRIGTEEEQQKRLGYIPNVIVMGVNYFRGNGDWEGEGYGQPTWPVTGRQHKVLIHLEGVPIPIMGYLDLMWPEHKLVTDIKTTGRMPSKISPAHCRQGAIYHASQPEGSEVRFTYITPKKIQTIVLENAEKHLEDVRLMCLGIEAFLELSNDRDKLVAACTPNPDSWMWSDADIELRESVFGF